jgi:hypothetical protein
MYLLKKSEKEKSEKIFKMQRKNDCNHFLKIDNDGANMIKSFLDPYSKICLFQSFKQVHKLDKDILLFQSLLNTRIFYCSNSQTQNCDWVENLENLDNVIQTIIKMFDIGPICNGMQLSKPIYSVCYFGDPHFPSPTKIEDLKCDNFTYSSPVWNEVKFIWSARTVNKDINLEFAFQGLLLKTRVVNVKCNGMTWYPKFYSDEMGAITISLCNPYYSPNHN